MGGMTTSHDVPTDEGGVEVENELVLAPVPNAPNLSPSVIKEGYLRKQAQNFGREWAKRYFVLTPNALFYYHHSSDFTPRCRIDLISASVKAAPMGEKYQMRRFRVLTPLREYLLEAEREEEAADWIGLIHNSIQANILESSQQNVPESIGIIVGSRKILEEIISIPGNEVCADCGGPHPAWVSTNLGIVLCIDCSGIHRSLGCQKSRVRSLELDAFLPETLKVIRLLGNARMNAVWEAELSESEKSNNNKNNSHGRLSPVERRLFIEEKYIQRTFTGEAGGGKGSISPMIGPRGSSASLFSPELALFENVQTLNVTRTAELLFRYKIDVNTTHRITNTTPLHLAAAANQLLQVHFLLLNGANATARDQQGRSPGEVALRCGHAELAEHLAKYQSISEHGAKRSLSTKSLTSSEASTAQRIRRALATGGAAVL